MLPLRISYYGDAMLEANVKGVRIRFYFGFFAAVMLYFYMMKSDTFGISAALCCCILHELGHLCAMCLLSSPPDSINFYFGGIKIIPKSGFCSRSAMTAILSAGCVANFLAAAVSATLGLDKLCSINLALGLVNMLPFSSLDGGHLLDLYGPPRLRKGLAIALALSIAAAVVSTGTIDLSAAALLVFIACSEFFM